ncbi:MAG: serine hydrolase domain-containing protein [Pyrinomonadaceae bacterium]
MRKLTALMALSVLLISFVIGQVPPALSTDVTDPNVDTPATIAPVEMPQMTGADLDAFLDGIVPILLAKEDIAGVTISVVKDGKVLVAKGYGYSDVATKKLVTADQTLFRPGSISKLFTWTAVMQLAEQGKLDLKKDINEYLDFKIPEAFGKPITLENILTHTPGFEEQLKDLFGGEKSPNLGVYVKNHIPNRIFPPGTVPAYSNYGTALAGYIVERVSGQAFDEYIELNIFRPLEMNSSSFRQPLPESLAPNMSKAYILASDEPKPFEIVGPYPAGSLSSTATDMSKFMIAHLQDGKFGDTQILKPETARLMHSRLFALDDQALAMAHGFYEESRNGHRIIGHGGDTVAFHSDLHLIPDANVGFFISQNSAGKGVLRTAIWDAFLNRYFPFDEENRPTIEAAKQDAASVAGTYLPSRRAEHSLFRIMALLGQPSVYPNEDGTISVDALTDPNGKPKKWRIVAPMTFRDLNGQDTLIFKPDANGRMQIVVPYPFMTFTRVGSMDNSKLILPAVGLSLLVMIVALVLWFVGWFVRRHYGGKIDLTPREKQLRYAVRIIFAIDVLFIIALLAIVTYLSSHLDFFSDSGNFWIRLAQIVGLIGVVGTPVILYAAIHTFTSKRYRIWGKLQAAVFALASLGFLWFVYAGNLLNFTSTF